MAMNATVIRSNRQSLLVRNEANGEEVMVFFRNANAFSPGDRIRIIFNGQMTMSIPPQISAISIQRLRPAPPSPHPSPRQMRAVVLQSGRNALIVRDTRDQRQIRVEYPHAHHFCAGQRVDIRYDTITMSNPPRVSATDIFPVC